MLKYAYEDPGGDLGWRHLLPSAQVADLVGMTEDQQVDANYGMLKDMTLSGPVGLAVRATNAVVPGASLALSPLVGPLIHKGVKDLYDENSPDTGLRHSFAPAREVSYAGATPKQQVQANWDSIKLNLGGLLGAAATGYAGYNLGENDSDKIRNAILGGLAGGVLGRTGTFLGLRALRRNEREEEYKKRKRKARKKQRKALKKKASTNSMYYELLQRNYGTSHGLLKRAFDNEEKKSLPFTPEEIEIIKQKMPDFDPAMDREEFTDFANDIDRKRQLELIERRFGSETRKRIEAEIQREDEASNILDFNSGVTTRNNLRNNVLSMQNAGLAGLAGAGLGAAFSDNKLTGALTGGGIGAGAIGGARAGLDLRKYVNNNDKLAMLLGGLLGAGAGGAAGNAIGRLFE